MVESLAEKRQIKWRRKMLKGPSDRASGYEINGLEGINTRISEAGDDPILASDYLTEFLFRAYPNIPDYAPSLSDRFKSALFVMETYPHGRRVLMENISEYFTQKQKTLEAGYMLTPSSNYFGYEGLTKIFTNYERVNVTDQIAQRAITWNKFVQDMISSGQEEKLFTEHPYTQAIRPADGTKLPVGNLVVEVIPWAQRLETSAHIGQNLQERWSLNDPPNQWFVMTHVMEKDMLNLARSLETNTIDGMHLTPEVYAKSYKQILDLIRINTHLNIPGVLSDATWIYSSELKKLFPNQAISKLHDMAGDVVELGPAEEIGMPEQVIFATQNQERKQAYEEGKYKVSVVSRFIDKAGMEAVVRRYNPFT